MTLRILLLPSFHGEADLYLNLLYIAQFMESEGHKVAIFDVNKFYNEEEQRVDLEKLLELLREHVKNVDIVAMSSYKMYIQNDKFIYDKIREFRSDIPILIGGWGPTCFPHVYARYFKGSIILRGVHGQAVRALLNLLKIYDKYSEFNINLIKDIRSICVEHNNEIIMTKLDDVIGSSELPTIDWSVERLGLNIEDYVAEDGTLIIPVLGAVASCPKYYRNPCIYCSIGKQIAYYKIEYGEETFRRKIAPRLVQFDTKRVVTDVVRAVKQFSNVNSVSRIVITLVDDCTTPWNFRRFIEELLRYDIINDIASLKFQTRPEYVEKILDVCRRLCPELEEKLVIDVGVEHFSHRDLSFSRREYDSEVVNKCLEILHNSRCRWTMYVILTTPISRCEDFEINMENILRWIDKTYLVRSNPYIFEEGTFVPEVIGEDNIKYIKVDSIEIPVRPRFVISCEDIKKMLELVDHYADYLNELKTVLIKQIRDEISTGFSSNSKLMKLSLMLHNVEDLLSSLSMLKEALLEDFEVKCSSDDSVPFLIDEEDNRC